MRYRIGEEEHDWPFIQFLDRFISARAQTDANEHRQQRVFVASHISSLIIGCIFALYTQIVGDAHAIAAVFGVGLALHAGSLFGLAMTGARVPLAMFSGTVYLGQLVALVYLLGGVHAAPTYVWWASLPVMALFMVSGPLMWLMTTLLFILTLAVGIMDTLGITWAVRFPQTKMGEFTLLSTVLCLAHVSYLLWIVQRVQMSIEATLRKNASIDSLTGALNHGAFLRYAKMCVRTCQRLHYPCIVAVLDMDHFKAVNDRQGHAAGDRVLKRLVEACREYTRDTDAVGRLGGDEFAIVLPNADAHSGVEVMKRIQNSLRETCATDWPEDLPPASSSIGMAEWKPGAPEFGASELLDFADQQMYDVKRTGRGGIGVRDALRSSSITPSHGAGSAAH